MPEEDSLVLPPNMKLRLPEALWVATNHKDRRHNIREWTFRGAKVQNERETTPGWLPIPDVHVAAKCFLVCFEGTHRLFR